MRVFFRAALGLALGATIAGCGAERLGSKAPGLAAPEAPSRVAGRYGLLTNGTTCPTTGCQRFLGTGTVTVDVQGSLRTLSLAFDVTESGPDDVGTITLVSGSTTFTNPAAPVVTFDGDEVVVIASLSSPPPFAGDIDLTLRFDRTNPTIFTATVGSEVGIPVTSFQALDGPCGPCRAYTGSGRYADPERTYYFNVVDRASDDLGVVSIDVIGSTYLGTAPAVTRVGDLVTIAVNAVRASDNADVDVRIEFNAVGPQTAAIYLDGLLIDPAADQSVTSASSCELFPEN